MILVRIALRNLARNRRRTALSLLVIAFGVTALLVTAGFIRYSFDGLSDALIQGGLGHLEVAPTAALDSGGSLLERSGAPPALTDWARLRDAIESRPHVRGAGAALQFAGVATHGDRTGAVLGVATEPDRVRRMGMTVKVRSGEALADEPPNAGDDEALVGVGLAASLDVQPGDVITVMGTTVDGTLNAIDLRVRGTMTSGFQDLDGRLIQVHVATAGRLLATDAVSSLIVSVDDTARTAAVMADLEAVIAAHTPPLSMVDWETRAPFYRQVRGLYVGIFVVLGIIIGGLVTLSVANTLMMSVMERVREFGTLLAIGTRRGQLAALMTLEAVWLAILGSLLGCVLALITSSTVNALHIDMPPPPAAVDPIELALRASPSDYAVAAAFMVVLLLIAAIAPMLRVLRLEVIEALGHV